MIGQRNRFGYDSTARGWEFNFDFDGVMQYDYETGASARHTYGPTQVSGEHIFAADPDGSAENDGWLMSFVTDRATGASELAIIDARDVSAGPVATVTMAARVPIGFHANWFAAE
jgi:carotenoid cleavage dioxygenase